MVKQNYLALLQTQSIMQEHLKSTMKDGYTTIKNLIMIPIHVKSNKLKTTIDGLRSLLTLWFV